jgi:hypothetical protein
MLETDAGLDPVGWPEALVDRVVARLRALDIPVTARPDDHLLVRDREEVADGVLTVGGVDYALQVASGSEAAWRRLATSGGVAGRHPVFVMAPTINTAVGERLADAGVDYCDAAGNVRIRQPGLIVEVSGREADVDWPAPPRRTARRNRAAGVRVVFGLICLPDLVGRPMRQIGLAAGVSPSTVHDVLSDLEASGFLAGTGERRQMLRQGVLVREWIGDYRVELRPKGLLGRFEAEPHWWRQVTAEQLAGEGALWGGETAADLLGGHLRTARGVLYASQLPRSLLAAHRMKAVTRRDDEGFAEVRRTFWSFVVDAPGPDLTVPPLLVYADLLAQGEPRLAEAAVELGRTNDALRRLLEAE